MRAAVGILGFIVVFGVGGSTLYLLITNRATRQGLHDLAVGSYVVKAGEPGPVGAMPIWRIHWIVLGLIFVLAISIGALAGDLSDLQTDLTPLQTHSELAQDSRLVQQVVEAPGGKRIRIDVPRHHRGRNEENPDPHDFMGGKERG